MKTFLIFALLAAGFSMGTNANASTTLSCLANGIASHGRVTMVKETENRFVVSNKTFDDKGQLVGLVTTHLYVEKTSKTATGETNYTGLAERQISPDGFAKFDFQLQLTKNEAHAGLSLLNYKGEVFETHAFACMHPDNR